MGFEPTTSGTTTRRSNRLNYSHHVPFCECKDTIFFNIEQTFKPKNDKKKYDT